MGRNVRRDGPDRRRGPALIPIKAEAVIPGEGETSEEVSMSESAIPFVAAVVGMFSLFILVVGGVSTWTNLPPAR